jgi:RND family efflux transporter MFP subunit
MMRIVNHQSLIQAVLLAGLGIGGNALAVDVPELDCVIEPHIVVDLSSRTDGIVESIEVDRGDLVQENQVVVQLESGVERAAVEYARAAANAESDLQSSEVRMTFAERRRDRLEVLYREQALSPDQMDEMETEAILTALEHDQAAERQRLAQLELHQTLEVLERHTVRSPITGVVVQRFLAPGESVEEKPIIRLAQVDPLRVEVIVPVSYFGAIQAGQQAVVMPERPMQNPYRAEVTLVDRVADAASGTYRVRLSLPNPDHSLPSGLKCMVRFLPEVNDVSTKAATDTEATKPAVAADANIEPAADSVPDVLADASTQTRSETATRPVSIAHAGLSGEFTPEPAAPRTARPAKSIKRPSATAAFITGQPEDRSFAASGAICQTIGPLDNEARANAVKTVLSDYADRLTVRRDTSGNRSGIIVLSADQKTLTAAKALAEKMSAAGAEDLYVFGRGPHRGRVSLGLYNGEISARQRVREIKSLGFAAEAVPRDPVATRYWVNVESARQIVPADLPAEARELLVDLNAAPAECERRLVVNP